MYTVVKHHETGSKNLRPELSKGICTSSLTRCFVACLESRTKAVVVPFRWRAEKAMSWMPELFLWSSLKQVKRDITCPNSHHISCHILQKSPCLPGETWDLETLKSFTLEWFWNISCFPSFVHLEGQTSHQDTRRSQGAEMQLWHNVPCWRVGLQALQRWQATSSTNSTSSHPENICVSSFARAYQAICFQRLLQQVFIILVL